MNPVLNWLGGCYLTWGIYCSVMNTAPEWRDSFVALLAIFLVWGIFDRSAAKKRPPALRWGQTVQR